MTAGPPALDAGTARTLLTDMVRIRRFEERCVELYSAAEIRGFVHLYIGEEAVATGVSAALRPDDNVVATYRDHGHALVRGVSARSIMAEMFGKAEGCSRGRGGSMHLFSAEHRFYGGNAIVGGGIPVAGGLALADQALGSDRVTVCFFGEGAMAEGEFHETMNLAALWDLPVLFCCENNLYAMGTALDRSEAVTDMALKASAYGLPSWSVDGMDVEAVLDGSRRAVDTIRAGGGPVFLEARTYRFRAHSMYDPELYRGHDEVERWRERDPIAAFTARVTGAGLLDESDLAAIEEAAASELDDAVAFARAGTLERVEDLTRFVYAEAAPGEDRP